MPVPWIEVQFRKFKENANAHPKFLVHNDSKPISVILEGELYDQQTIAHYRFRRRCGVSDRAGSYGRR